MADQSLEILIKTTADLAGAKAAEAQLERDIAKAKSLGEAYDDLETRLKKVREAMAASQENDAHLNDGELTERAPSSAVAKTLWRDEPLTPFPSERRGESEARWGNDAKELGSGGTVKAPTTLAAEDQKSEAPKEAEVQDGEGSHRETQTETGGNTPLEWVKAGMEGLRLALGAIPKFFGAPENPVTPASGHQDKISNQDQPLVPSNRTEGQQQQVTEKVDNAAAAGTTPTNGPLPSFGESPDERVAGGNTQNENGVLGQVAEGHAQAIQSSGEKVRAALEQNTQITVSLFNRTLELIEQQNRKLDEVNQRIAELNGQIKSLKNL